MESFTWTLRVTAARGERATVFVRKHRFEVGAPAHFDEAYEEVTALEYALGAVGADLVNGLRLIARGRHIDIDRVEALVDGELDDPLAYAGVIGAAGHPGIRRIRVTVYAETPVAAGTVEALWKEARARSPLVRTLERTVELDLRLKVTT